MSRLNLRRIRHKPQRLRHLSKTLIKGTMTGVPEKRTGLTPDFTGTVLRSPSDKAITMTYTIGIDGVVSVTEALVLFDDTNDERAAKIATALDAVDDLGAIATTNNIAFIATGGFTSFHQISSHTIS